MAINDWLLFNKLKCILNAFPYLKKLLVQYCENKFLFK